MEVLAQTDYQDLYRITDGVLLVVNKFKYIDYSNKTTDCIRVWLSDAKYKRYNKSCQEHLKELKQDYFDKYATITIPKGTVLYMGIPVVSTNDTEKWRYEVKTTGSSLSGKSKVINKYLNDILSLINCRQR